MILSLKDEKDSSNFWNMLLTLHSECPYIYKNPRSWYNIEYVILFYQKRIKEMIALCFTHRPNSSKYTRHCLNMIHLQRHKINIRLLCRDKLCKYSCKQMKAADVLLHLSCSCHVFAFHIFCFAVVDHDTSFDGNR